MAQKLRFREGGYGAPKKLDQTGWEEKKKRKKKTTTILLFFHAANCINYTQY